MKKLIKDVERGFVLDSILIERDSILKEKEFQISVLDTIAKKKDFQISMLQERVDKRTDELNISLLKTSEYDSKINKRNKIITWLSFGIAIETLILILK